MQNTGKNISKGGLMTGKRIHSNYMQWPAQEDDLIRVMCWKGDKPVQSHRHEYIEIAFIAKGACSHAYHNSTVRLIPGDVFVITPHEDHSYEISSDTVIYNCLFYPEALGEDWDRLKKTNSIYDLLIVEPFYRPETGHQEVLHLSPAEAEYVESLLRKMMEEQKRREEGFELVLKAFLGIFLCTLGRIWKKRFGEANGFNSNRRGLLSDAMAFIENNIKDEIKIGDIASKAYLSPGYFCKVFKETTGVTPIDYINGIRIEKARKLLEDQSLTVSEVGEAVGIRDLNYFSKVFKSKVGCTPSEFRKRLKEY